MYFPPLKTFVDSLRIDPAALDSNARIPVPGKLLKLLLKMALTQGDFNAQSYLERNPDVRNAVQTGQVADALDHYIGYGYFEDRRGATWVDPQYYTLKYPDVAAAIARGSVASAEEHYYSAGCREARFPNREAEADVVFWNKVLQG
jgi:hypothetical protein